MIKDGIIAIMGIICLLEIQMHTLNCEGKRKIVAVLEQVNKV